MRVNQEQESTLINLDNLSKVDRGEPMISATYPSEFASPPPGYHRDPSLINEDAQEPLFAQSRNSDNPWQNCITIIPRRTRPIALGLLVCIVILVLSASRSNCPSDADIVEARRNWVVDREKYQQETRQWEEQRKEWQREREDEARRRKDVEMRRKGVYWTEPEGSAQCAAYSTRRYTAVLRDIPKSLNWLEVCSDMPAVIHDRTLDRPDKCERKDDGTVLGTWIVGFNEPVCVPYWDSISDKGCKPGALGMRRLQGRLWGLRAGDDWEKMCSTTPATFKDASFEHPSSCENKGSLLGGIIGSWDYPDETC